MAIKTFDQIDTWNFTDADWNNPDPMDARYYSALAGALLERYFVGSSRNNSLVRSLAGIRYSAGLIDMAIFGTINSAYKTIGAGYYDLTALPTTSAATQYTGAQLGGFVGESFYTVTNSASPLTTAAMRSWITGMKAGIQKLRYVRTSASSSYPRHSRNGSESATWGYSGYTGDPLADYATAKSNAITEYNDTPITYSYSGSMNIQASFSSSVRQIWNNINGSGLYQTTYVCGYTTYEWGFSDLFPPGSVVRVFLATANPPQTASETTNVIYDNGGFFTPNSPGAHYADLTLNADGRALLDGFMDTNVQALLSDLPEIDPSDGLGHDIYAYRGFVISSMTPTVIIDLYPGFRFQ